MLVAEGTALAQVITSIARNISAKNLPRFAVGIQLVQIGNDALVSAALQSLDNKLPEEPGVLVGLLSFIFAAVV